MAQHIAGFEKAHRHICLLVPLADLSPMDVDKYVKGGELVNETQISEDGDNDGEFEGEVTSARNDDVPAC